MLGVSVSSSSTTGLGEKVSRGVRRAMTDAADAGFAVSFDEAPDGATSGLKLSAVEPTWEGDTLVWGYNAEYAKYVEKGTGAHYPPIDPLKQWAARVLNDEGAAYAIQQKIAEEGTDPQPFVEPGVEEMSTVLQQQGISAYIDDNL